MRKILCCLTLLLFLPVTALGETITLIDDETDARQFALRFFANPLVDENVSDTEMTFRSIGGDYVIDVHPGDRHGALMLRFDDAGVIRQYWNQEWHFPKLTAYDSGWTGIDWNEQDALIRDADSIGMGILNGRTYDSYSLMRSDENEERGIFTLRLNDSEAYLALRAEPLKLYGFLDTAYPESTDQGVAISIVNASVFARSAVAHQLPADLEIPLSTGQPFFNYMGSTAADGSPIPVWEVLVHAEYDDRSDTYDVILHAQTGEILQVELQEHQSLG